MPSTLPSCLILHPPHFFTVVLKMNLDHKKLMIPEGFVREHGKFLKSWASLKVPDGKEWKVGLTTAANGAVWMQNGWHEFAEYYGLDFGSFLVFRFDGNSTFHTMIFDINGLEIQYSSTSYFDDSDEKLDHFSPSPQKEKALFLPKLEPEEEGCNKVDAAGQRLSSKSEKPGFKFVMRESNVGGRFEMIIPEEFAGEYFSDEFGMIRVQTSNGRTWPLIYKWRRNQGNFAYISSGWKRFAEENLLKEGDVGFFQLIQKDQFLFTILQNNTSRFTTPPSSRKNKTSNTTRNPYFEVDVALKNYRNSVLHIPKGFAKEHLSAEMHSAKLVVGNKEWNVKLKQYDDRVRFSAGWTTFYKQNCLEDASCLFELVNKKDCVFKVTIFKYISSTSDSEEDYV